MTESALLGLFKRRPHERAGYMLYTSAVRAARDPALYAGGPGTPGGGVALDVPDTLDGRFDLVGLHAFLLVDRLHTAPPPGPALAQAVFDAMFADMDRTLRELGVGDMTVSRRNKEMWEAFHGRARAYEAALAADDPATLAEVLGRNVWRGAAPPGAPEALAEQVRALRDRLAAQPLERFAEGQSGFPDAEAA